VLDVVEGGLQLVELADGVTRASVEKMTGVPLL